jgi:hypothetical protein
VREAQVRFYVDADLLGLAKILTQLRADATYPGDPGGTVRKRIRPACPITTPATKDHVWIPTVTERGWLIVTRNSRIQSHRAELGAVREHGARMIALAGREAVDIRDDGTAGDERARFARPGRTTVFRRWAAVASAVWLESHEGIHSAWSWTRQ